MTEPDNEPTRAVPPAEEPPRAAPPPPPPPPPRPVAWGRPPGSVLAIVLVGVIGLLMGCVIGGGIGFVAGHVTGRAAHHARFDNPRPYPGGPGFRRPHRGPVQPVPAPATPSPSHS